MWCVSVLKRNDEWSIYIEEKQKSPRMLHSLRCLQCVFVLLACTPLYILPIDHCNPPYENFLILMCPPEDRRTFGSINAIIDFIFSEEGIPCRLTTRCQG
eukprot:m.96535 g.96535  ORF g.96535 m.96535 type:complete len:100 (+) comp12469_c0_seq2:141-440(+)